MSSFLYSVMERHSVQNLFAFISLVIVSLAGQFLIFYLLRKKNSLFQITKTKSLFVFQILLIVSWCINAVLFANLFSQILNASTFETIYFKLILFSNYTISLINLCFLIQNLFSWVRRTRNLIMVVYIVAISVFMVNEITSSLILYFQLENRAQTISFITHPWDTISLKSLSLTNLYNTTSIVSFTIMWIATCLIMYHYSRKIGKIKFWILAGLPLIYFGGNIDLIRLVIFTYFERTGPELLLPIQFLLGGAKQIGGFFFALAFITIAMKIDVEKLKYYLLIFATGIMLLYSSNQISLVQVIPYPPFGLVTISFLPLSSFLILVGLRNLASSMAFDRTLLESARRIVTEKASTFLYDIGSAQWQHEMDKTIPMIMESGSKHMDDAFVPTSLSEDEMRSYINEVTEELEKLRDKKDS